ncbi:hypothetical protein [Sphingobacterium faecium]|uniref:hypothetical protein n=1 Tax=Sphingobacterium faecium TaxID=34087 RepID=UPI000D3C92A3|nr:hypothetical protein [Sphingobacterium faecium]PTX09475.1 hypothetical protein C8N37_106103 [Sphingobacterium faecium]
MSLLKSLKNGKYENDTLSKNQTRHITGGTTVTRTDGGKKVLPDGSSWDYCGDLTANGKTRLVGASWGTLDNYMKSDDYAQWLKDVG